MQWLNSWPITYAAGEPQTPADAVASDYPYDMATDAARWIDTAPISENDRRNICKGNAAALFGLPSVN
jgi:hypothetical protein